MSEYTELLFAEILVILPIHFYRNQAEQQNEEGGDFKIPGNFIRLFDYNAKLN